MSPSGTSDSFAPRRSNFAATFDLARRVLDDSKSPRSFS